MAGGADNIIGKGNRFSSTNQPLVRGRKPKLYTKLSREYGLGFCEYKEVCLSLLQKPLLSLSTLAKEKDTPAWVAIICRALIKSAQGGELRTLQEMTRDIWAREIAAERTPMAASEGGVDDVEAMSRGEILDEIRRLSAVTGTHGHGNE